MHDILLKTGILIVGNGETLEKVSILIQEGIITEVGRDITPPNDVEILDFSSSVIMPGIIDPHVHVCFDGSPNLEEVRRFSDELLAIRGSKLTEILLEYGITTVGDAAGRKNVPFAVKEAIDRGFVTGPRFLPCGRMITISGGRDSLAGANEADGVDGVRRAVREELGRGIFYIKLAATGAISSEHTESFSTQFSLDELKVGADEARKAGKRSHAHAYGEEGIRNTILAGVDVLVHGHPLSSENLDLMKKHGTMYMPTFVTYYESQLHHDDGDLPEYMVRKEKEIFPLIEEGVRNAIKAGIEIVVGTDSGMPYTYYGKSTAEEMELLVRLGGASEMDAIIAGTMNAAKSMSMESKIGTIKPGKSADLLVLSPGKNPLEDITVLQYKENIKRVILRGKTVIDRN
ncbi:amidohydrolase family protein [Candidatus Thorarchaeota archaeon]|nr:MAG: amidohydrolase family protein [Candidatus Thorarchaeota archaeon]